MTVQVLSAVTEDVTVFWGVMRRRVVRELTQTFQKHLSPSSPVEAVDSSEVSVHFIPQYTASRGRRCYLYESEFTLCVQFVRCSVDPRAVWSFYLEARFLRISYIPVAVLSRVSLIMRVDHCSVGNHRKSGCGHAHCCHYPCFSVVIKCGDNTN